MSHEIRTFRDLIAWQKAMLLCNCVYALSASFPDSERFGLTSQIRRAVVSIPSNIAEGYGRRRKQDYLRFLDIARGSLFEVETQLELAEQLGFAGPDATASSLELVHETARIVFGLVRSLEQGKGMKSGL
jgi:four helix bundle protein